MTSTQSSTVAELDLLTVSGRAMIERIGILESERHATATFSPAWFAITKRIHDVEREHEMIAQRRWDILRADVNLSESTFAILPDLPLALPSGLDAAPVDPAPAAVERPNVPFVATHIDISNDPVPPAVDACPEWARSRQWSYTVTRKTDAGSEVIKTGTIVSDRDYNNITFHLAFAWNVRTWHRAGHKQDDTGLITAVRMWGRQNKAIITVIAELMPEKPAAVDTGRTHGPSAVEWFLEVQRIGYGQSRGLDMGAETTEAEECAAWRAVSAANLDYHESRAFALAQTAVRRSVEDAYVRGQMHHKAQPTPAAIIAAAAQAAQAAGRELTMREACALFDQRAACLADGELHDACNWAEIDMADIDEWSAASRARLIADYRAAVA